MPCVHAPKFLLVAFGFVLLGCGEIYRDQAAPIHSVDTFAIDRYLGTWYEIARYPNRFERDCYAVTAQYSLRDDGKVRVLNTCRKGAIDGPVKTADGVARVVGIGQLEVNFAPLIPFAKGDYWVLGQQDYDIAVVGNPGGRTGWILARKPVISPGDRAWAEGVLHNNGYDPAALDYVGQISN